MVNGSIDIDDKYIRCRCIIKETRVVLFLLCTTEVDNLLLCSALVVVIVVAVLVDAKVPTDVVEFNLCILGGG